MSDLSAPLPDPSEPQPQGQPSPEVRPPIEAWPAPSPQSPDVDTPAVQMARAAAEGLSDSQRTVMTYLAAGNSIAKAARIAQVTRRTVHRWLKEDAEFCAVYNAWRRELTESAKTRALAMSDDAMDTIHNAILAGDVKASLALAKSMGILDKPRPGPEDPRQIAHKRRVRKMRRAVARERELHDARYGLSTDDALYYTPEERARKEEESRRRREENERAEQEEPEWRKRWRQAKDRPASTAETSKAPHSPQPPPDPAPPAESEAAAPEQPGDPRG